MIEEQQEDRVEQRLNELQPGERQMLNQQQRVRYVQLRNAGATPQEAFLRSLYS